MIYAWVVNYCDVNVQHGRKEITEDEDNIEDVRLNIERFKYFKNPSSKYRQILMNTTLVTIAPTVHWSIWIERSKQKLNSK